jgi:hypothetical protein
MRISERDLETISAYLDGQLPQRERTRLETRLETDPGLREAYEQMHRTRAVLRSLPAVRAPRNFTLTPQMVKVRKSPPAAYPVLRLASVLATLMFVLVMVGDLMTPRGVVLAPVPEAQTEEGMTLMEAPAETEAAMLEAAPAAEPEEGSRKTMTEDQAAGETPPPAGMMEMMGPTPEENLTATPVASPELPSGADPQTSELEQVEPALPVPADRNTWRILEVLFALVALSTGLAAAFLRRGMTG